MDQDTEAYYYQKKVGRFSVVRGGGKKGPSAFRSQIQFRVFRRPIVSRRFSPEFALLYVRVGGYL